MTRNQEVANLLYEISQILELQGVPFKPRAYQRAAMNIESLNEDVEVVAREGRLQDVPGVGDAIREKIEEYLAAGKLEYLEKLHKEFPRGLLELLRVPNLGPKKAMRLHEELKIDSIARLEEAARSGRIRGLSGFGERSERILLESLRRVQERSGRVPYPHALDAANQLLAYLRDTKLATRLEAAGSLRRGRDTVGDVDLLAVTENRNATPLVDAFKKYPGVVSVLESGSTRARVILSGGLQVDLRIVEEASYGAALLYFTGSKEHNIQLRTLALRKGYTINEYALSRKKDGRRTAGATEEEIYKKLGLAWVAPELREGHGEIEQAAKGTLPRLVELRDLRGDLHTHTRASDGTATLCDMAAEAARLGYAWFGVSDHSQGLGIARGLDAARYAQQRREIAKVQEAYPQLRILQGAEVNIRKDGRLDLDARTLAALDYVVGSLHSAFQLSAADQTRRVLEAIKQGIDVFAHPSTRLLGERPEVELDWNRVFDAAARDGVALEINASPFRLDLAGERVRAARARGSSFVVDSDAHTVTGLGALGLGVTQARRGGLKRNYVWSTLTVAQLQRHLGRSKRW